MKIKNNWNYVPSEDLCEKGGGEIMTEPGQSYSVKQLIIRYQNGLPLPRLSQQYDDIFEEDLNPFRRPDLDLTDLTEANEHIEAIRTKVEQHKKTKSHEMELKNNPVNSSNSD